MDFITFLSVHHLARNNDNLIPYFLPNEKNIAMILTEAFIHDLSRT